VKPLALFVSGSPQSPKKNGHKKAQDAQKKTEEKAAADKRRQAPIREKTDQKIQRDERRARSTEVLTASDLSSV